MNVRPTLWHLPISHYSEKARWALDVKGVEHRRRTAPPGIHMAVALRLTRGRGFTFPILVLDGRAIADSTAIVQVLEQGYRTNDIQSPGAKVVGTKEMGRLIRQALGKA